MSMHNMIEITAKFIGKDDYYYKNGKVYQLWIFTTRGYDGFYISKRSPSSIAVPYDTMTAIRRNWEIVGW